MNKIIRTSPSGAYVGLEDGKWSVEGVQGVTLLDEKAPLHWLYPLFEQPLSSFLESLRASLEASNYSGEIASTFPVRSLIRDALKSGSGHWKEQALNWLEEIPVWDEAVQELEAIRANRKWPQPMRHRIQRLLARR